MISITNIAIEMSSGVVLGLLAAVNTVTLIATMGWVLSSVYVRTSKVAICLGRSIIKVISAPVLSNVGTLISSSLGTSTFTAIAIFAISARPSTLIAAMIATRLLSSKKTKTTTTMVKKVRRRVQVPERPLPPVPNSPKKARKAVKIAGRRRVLKRLTYDNVPRIVRIRFEANVVSSVHVVPRYAKSRPEFQALEQHYSRRHVRRRVDRKIAAAGPAYNDDIPTLIAEVQAQHDDEAYARLCAEDHVRLEALRARFYALCPEDRHLRDAPRRHFDDPNEEEAHLENYINFGEDEVERLQARNAARRNAAEEEVNDGNEDFPLADDVGDEIEEGEEPQQQVPLADDNAEEEQLEEEWPQQQVPLAEDNAEEEELGDVVVEEEEFKPRRSPRIAALNAKKAAKAKKAKKANQQPTRFSRRVRGLPP